ncbi:hypothetical protein Poli38472_009239 [Pythium oligandrum]|uniref:RNA polymerase II subunit A C-terminal domain phosphatase SSU72 n=1 Tax=Pythium oligandrum TaxID=41045 RepID=A0A8K1FMP3_PYTOL|nr:hypothetical protein Poli38472_009239 [Pythium oligandrum]|eukprot:TMW65072.1 hypothetical protein Poli38472_009239 [Pythium oligandrum]
MSGDFRPLMMTSNSCETVDETKEEAGGSVKFGPELSGEVETVEEQRSDEEEQDEDEESMHGKRSVECNEACEATDMNQCAVQRSERGLVGHVRRKLKKRPGVGGTRKARPMFATVCVNNVNRSMAAHVELQKAGLRVCSFGGGPRVCFPGRNATSFRAFSFLMSYETMYKTLREEDEELFTRNGVLQMLERDMQVKRAPQQWQQLTNKQLHDIDVIVCLDYQMFIRILNGK